MSDKTRNVGILTFHDANNYGALLQAYALMRYINNLNINAEIINYQCDAIIRTYRYPKVAKLRKNIVAWMLDNRALKNRKAKALECDYFRNRYLTLSDAVSSSEDRKSIQREYDVIITGSDQIWNPKLTDGKDDWYCFKTDKESDCRVISYAASVGSIDYFDSVASEYFVDLREYRAIAVREESTKEYFEKRLNLKCNTVVDPTFLLPSNDWIQLAQQSTFIIQKPYVLYYDVDYNSIAHSITKKVCDAYHLSLVHFSDRIHGFSNCYHNAQSKGPIEFISLILNAQFIVTSSFHATVFSILFRKKFISVPHPKTGTRVRDLLINLGLEKRICDADETDCINTINDPIDYMEVERRLEPLVQESKAYITKNI